MSRSKTIKEKWINLTTTVNIISNKVTRKWKNSKNIWSIYNRQRSNISNIRAFKINKKNTNIAIEKW